MSRSLRTIRKLSKTDIIYVALVALGGTATLAAAHAQHLQDPCPTSELAPWGIVPDDDTTHCTDPDRSCLVSFSNYKWWTAFNYVGNYHNQYYYNFGLKTVFAPEHSFVDGQGLHLIIDNDINLGGGKEWTGAEAVLMFDSKKNEINFGYGDYLVSVESSTFLNMLDPNVAVGIFTYERYGRPPVVGPWPSFGGLANPNREIDLAEISRWGWDQKTGTCPNEFGRDGLFHLKILCKGNAQFATQRVPESEISVQRYDIGSNVTEMTLVMQWRQGHVTFLKFNGGNIHLNSLPTTPTETWTTDVQVRNNTAPVYTDSSFKVTTPAELSRFIPDPTRVTPEPPGARGPTQSCARFHLNFWLGNYKKMKNGKNPGPTDNKRQEVIITNFEYAPP
jgi:hypothetical protein